MSAQLNDHHVSPSGEFRAKFNLFQTVLTIVIAVGTALLTIGATYGTISTRLSTVESRQESGKAERMAQMQELKEQVVPRPESEAHWKSTDDKLNSIQSDVREIRQMLIDERRAGK